MSKYIFLHHAPGRGVRLGPPPSRWRDRRFLCCPSESLNLRSLCSYPCTQVMALLMALMLNSSKLRLYCPIHYTKPTSIGSWLAHSMKRYLSSFAVCAAQRPVRLQCKTRQHMRPEVASSVNCNTIAPAPSTNDLLHSPPQGSFFRLSYPCPTHTN